MAYVLFQTQNNYALCKLTFNLGVNGSGNLMLLGKALKIRLRS